MTHKNNPFLQQMHAVIPLAPAAVNEALAQAERARRTADPVANLDLNGFRIELLGHRPSIENLMAFYLPYYVFQSGGCPSPDIRVYATVDAFGPGVDEDVTGMALILDRSEPSWADEGYAFHERPHTGISVLADMRNGEFFLLGSNPNNMLLQVRTFVRDQILRQVERSSGSVTFHSAAVEKGGEGVLFMGDRNAGKTSSLLACIARGDFNVVSPDRVKLSVKGRDVNVLGFPARCNVHRIAVQNDPLLQVIAAGREILFDHEDKSLIPMEEIAVAAGAKMSASCRFSCLMLPDIDATATGLEVSRCEDPGEISRALADNLMEGGEQDKHTHWLNWRVVSAETIRASFDATTERVLENVPVYRIRASHADYVNAIARGEVPFVQ